MYYNDKQLATVPASSSTETLLQRLAEWQHFVSECRVCQQELAPLSGLCAACEIRLGTHCPGCASPLPPLSAYGCPCCGVAMSWVGAWSRP
jgi:hypothetical protein